MKDIWPGPDSSLGGGFVRVGDELFFSAVDGPHAYELWKTDGTEAGTTKVASLTMYSAAAVGSTLFFTANDGVHGRELWKTDGTPGGTALVRDVNPGGTSGAELLVADGSTVFFRADDGVHGNELWRSDGTTDGTWMGR